MTEDLNPFALAQQKLDEAAAILNLDDATHQMLRFGLLDVCAPGIGTACGGGGVSGYMTRERTLITPGALKTQVQHFVGENVAWEKVTNN